MHFLPFFLFSLIFSHFFLFLTFLPPV
jgi:hypothetical protein